MAKKVLSLSQGNVDKAVAVLTDAIKQVSTMEDEGDNVLSSNEANAEVMLSSKLAEGVAGGWLRERKGGSLGRGRETGCELTHPLKAVLPCLGGNLVGRVCSETERRAVGSWKCEKDLSILCRGCFLSSRHYSCFDFLLGQKPSPSKRQTRMILHLYQR